MNDKSQSAVDLIVNGYGKLFEAADPRVDGLFLMDGPLPIVTICVFYIYFVLSLGPRLMADRKPFNLTNILLIYNAAQAVFSAVLFFFSLKHWIKCFGWGLGCFPINRDLRTPDELWSIRLCHVYFLSKISELADTVFFVLKKKNNHVNLLHVFHHAAMPFSVWFGVKFHPGGNLAFFGLPNLFVHIWMYLYYMVAALGPQYQRYIWWKRHITQMQLAQFALVMCYMLFISLKCNLNKGLVLWIFLLDIVFVVLFMDFYRKAYLKKKTEKYGEKPEDSEGSKGVKKRLKLTLGRTPGSKANTNELSCQKGNSAQKKNL